MGKVKAILAGLLFLSAPVFWGLTAQAAGNFGLDSITVLDKSTDVVAEAPTISDNTISSIIVFHKLDDYVKYGLKIKNSTSTSYQILDIIDNNSSDLVSYDYDNHADEIIEAGESLDLDLTISYIQEHVDDNDRTINNDVKFTISYLDLYTGGVEEDVIIMVPNTGTNTILGSSPQHTSNIMIFVIILAGVGLVSAIIYKKKRTMFVLAFSIVFAATGLSFINATAEDHISKDVSFSSEIRIRDYMYGEIFWIDPSESEDLLHGVISYDDGMYFRDMFNFDNWDMVPEDLILVGFKFTDTDTELDPNAKILDDFSVTFVYEARD